MNKFEFNKLCPFKWFVLENFPFIEADFDAITNYQLYCKVVEYLNKVIENNNAIGIQTENLTDAFIELQDYVNNYFDNLDVQEEINNKLDEMAESGTLQEIITQYLNTKAIFCFDNIEDMKQSTNLINGSYAKTLGFYNKNDGGMNQYKIRELVNNESIDNITTILLNNGLVAELIMLDNMSVKQFGAKGDGVQDDSVYFQKAIDNINNIFIPATNEFYKINETLNLKGDIVIHGIGQKSKILMPNNLVKTIFNIENCNNIILDNIKLCNESCQTGSSPDLNKNKLINCENVQNLTIKNCYFENSYSKGILIKRSKNINYINNIFKNATYDMLYLLQEVENVTVDNSVFDTIVSTYANTYLFATGRIDTETYTFSCKNITVKNSKFLNNPNWEGIDTHACIGFNCINNYVENCKVGIMAHTSSTAPVTSETIKQSNINIENNTLKCSNSTSSGRYGIIVGSGQSILKPFTEHVNISNNYIFGFGDNDTRASVQLEGIKDFTVLNNNIINSNGPAICLTACYNGKIKNNNLLESTNYGINCLGGIWYVDIVNNIIKNLEKTNLLRGVRGSTSSGYVFLLNIENNDVVATTRYQVPGTIMYGVLNQNTDQIGKKGSFIKDEYGFIKYYCTDTILRPAKTGTITQLNLTGNSDTKIVSGTNAMYYVGPGEEIIIPGAGLAGTDLTTQITKFINKDTFEIKDTILLSFENVHPNTIASTWVEV